MSVVTVLGQRHSLFYKEIHNLSVLCSLVVLTHQYIFSNIELFILFFGASHPSPVHTLFQH